MPQGLTGSGVNTQPDEPRNHPQVDAGEPVQALSGNPTYDDSIHALRQQVLSPLYESLGTNQIAENLQRTGAALPSEWMFAQKRLQTLWRGIADKQFKDRISAFTPEAIKASPGTIMQLALDQRKSDLEISKLAQGYNTAAPFLSGRMRFGGEDNAIQAATAYARLYHKTDALKVLDYMRTSMSETDQATVLGVLRDPEKYIKLINYNEQDALDWASKQADANPDPNLSFEEKMNQALDQYNQEYTVKGVTPQEFQNAFVALQQAVPGLQFTPQMLEDTSGHDVQFGAKVTFGENTPTSIDAGLRELFGIGMKGIFNTQVDSPEYYRNFIKKTTEAGEASLAIVGKAFSAPFEIAARAGRLAAPVLSGGKVHTGDIREADIEKSVQTGSFIGGGSLFKALDSVVRPAVNQTFGRLLPDDDPLHDRLVDTTAALTEIFILKKAGGYARGRAVGGSFITEEGGYAELGLPDSGLITGRYGGSFTRNIPGTIGDILNSPFLHPSRVLDAAVAKWGFDSRFKPIEEAVKSNPITVELFDKTEWTKQNIPVDEQVNYLFKHYGGQVPMDMVRALLDSPRTEMGTRFIDYFNDAETRVATISDLQSQIKWLKDQDARWNQPGIAPSILEPIENRDATPDIQATPGAGEGAARAITGDAEGYVYHVTDPSKFESIITDGKLNPYQSTYGVKGVPEYMTQPRLFFADSLDRARNLAPGPEGHVAFRVKADVVGEAHPEQSFSGSNYIKRPVEIKDIEYLADNGEWRPAKELAGENWLSQTQIDAMKLERMGLESQLIDVMHEKWNRPIFEYPRAGRYRASVFAPISHAERFAHNLMKPLKDLPRKFADDMPNLPRIHNPTLKDKPLDWAEAGATNLENWLARTGVDESTRNKIIGDWVRMEKEGTPSDFFIWAKGVAHTVDKALPVDTPKPLRLALTRWWDSPIESRPYGRLQADRQLSDGAISKDGEFVLAKADPTDPNATPIPLPSSPSEFVGHITLPDVNLAIDATAWTRRMARKSPVFGKLYNVGRFALKVGTGIWKAPILALRIPAMAMRIQLEQSLRAREYGGYRALSFTPGGVPASASMLDAMTASLTGIDLGWIGKKGEVSFAPPTEVDLGSLYGQLLGTHDSEVAYIERTAPYTLGTRTPDGVIFQGWADQISKIHNDWFDRDYVRLGLEPDKMMLKIQGGDPYFTKYFEDMQLPLLRDAWGTLADDALARRWLERKRDSILEVTKNDPELMEAVSTGASGKTGRLVHEDHLPNGKEVREQYDDLTSRLDAARTNLEDLQRRRANLTPEEANSMKVLQSEVLNIKSALAELADGYPDAMKSITSLRMSAKGQLRNYLQDRWGRGELEMPAEIRVKRHYSPEETKTPLEVAREIRRAWDKGWYSFYRPLSSIDVKFTRGSVYLQAAERRFEAFKSLGYPDRVARAYAQMEGATFVRDLMYDLSARNSMHRATKDVFWFAPATQEIMNTWLFKIPRQYGNVLAGQQLILARAQAWLALFKSVGAIAPGPDGKDRITIPGLTTALNALPGVKFGPEDSIYSNPQGLNLVLSGPVPSLSILPSAALGRASREWGGPFKDLSHWMQASGLMFSEDTSAIPRQISYFWEAATGHKFPGEFLSPEFSKARYDRSFDASIQHAYADFIAGGGKVPRPEDFADQTDPTNGKPSLSPAAEDKYHAAVAEFTQNIMGQATEYFRGTALVGLLGSSVAPSSLYVSNADREEFNKMWTNLLAQNPNGEGLDETQQQILNDYLSQHPGSIAYRTWYSVYTGKEGQATQATDPGDDQDWFQQFYDGQKRYLTGPEYLQSLQGTESYRYYTGRLNTALQDIAGQDLNPVELLKNGWQRQNALGDFVYEWDRYLALNSDVAARLQANKLAMHEEFGTPIKTFEVDRLNDTLQSLRQMAPFFSTEGGNRIGDYKTIMAKLTGLYSSTSEFGDPKTSTEKAMDWYFSNQFTPWADKVFPLYDRARKLGEAGEDASAVYDKIRRINNAQQPASYNGMQFPTPEEVIYGNKNKQEQRYAVYNWASKPAPWLTDFQLDKVGYANFAGRDKMLGQLADLTDEYYKAKAKATPGSDYADTLYRWYIRTGGAIARQYGDQGAEIWNLQNQPPSQRITMTGFGKSSSEWQWATTTAQELNDRIRQAGFSPSGFSETALFYKKWFYGQLETMAQSDKEFKGLLEDLSFSLPGKGDDQRLGVPLYEAVFFGNFNTDYIPPQLINYVGRA